MHGSQKKQQTKCLFGMFVFKIRKMDNNNIKNYINLV